VRDDSLRIRFCEHANDSASHAVSVKKKRFVRSVERARHVLDSSTAIVYKAARRRRPSRRLTHSAVVEQKSVRTESVCVLGGKPEVLFVPVDQQARAWVAQIQVGDESAGVRTMDSRWEIGNNSSKIETSTTIITSTANNHRGGDERGRMGGGDERGRVGGGDERGRMGGGDERGRVGGGDKRGRMRGGVGGGIQRTEPHLR
jgi:hypothetical protein